MPNLSTRLLLGAGAFSLTLGGLVAGVAQPALLKAPLVNSVETDAVGAATKLDSATGRQVAGTFRQHAAVGTHTVDGKAAGGGDVAVYDSYAESTFTPAGATTAVPLTKSLSTTAFDRSTGRGVPSDALDTTGTTAQVFKLPFGTEKKTYSYYDAQAGKAFPLTFVRETTVRGLDVYEFAQVVPPTDLGPLPVVKAVPGALVGEPGTPSIPADQWVENTDKRVFVEPVTGSVVSMVSNAHVWAQTADGRKVDLLRLSGVTATAETAKEVVASAQESRSKAQTLQRAPWALGALGVLLLLAGGLRSRRRGSDVVVDLTSRPDVSDALPAPRGEAPVEARLQR